MTAAAPTDARGFWEPLFLPGQGSQVTAQRTFRVVRKQGRPFLLLPRARRAALETLSLYPAQTPWARRGRQTLRLLLRLGLPTGLSSITLHLVPEDPFTQFLSKQTKDVARALPQFGVLAGNPANPAQRFIVLVFNHRTKPVAVVKAGLSEEAKSAILEEEQFLGALDRATTGIPVCRSALDIPRLRAFAMDYYPGDSPASGAFAEVASLLSSWVQPAASIVLSETDPWRRLAAAAADLPLFQSVASDVGNRPLAKTLFHGDFAPWNIRVSKDGAWTVLDWERGRLAGVPGWDWFHYTIQPAILVEHLSLPALVERVEKLLRSYLFRDYASRAGFLQKEREFLLSYLLHCIHVLKPSEGLEQNQALLQALSPSSQPA